MDEDLRSNTSKLNRVQNGEVDNIKCAFKIIEKAFLKTTEFERIIKHVVKQNVAPLQHRITQLEEKNKELSNILDKQKNKLSEKSKDELAKNETSTKRDYGKYHHNFQLGKTNVPRLKLLELPKNPGNRSQPLSDSIILGGDNTHSDDDKKELYTATIPFDRALYVKIERQYTPNEWIDYSKKRYGYFHFANQIRNEEFGSGFPVDEVDVEHVKIPEKQRPVQVANAKGQFKFCGNDY